MATQDDIKDQLLLVDYNTAADLLKHEDNRKAHLFSSFFLILSGMLGFYSLVETHHLFVDVVVLGIALFLCALWFLVMSRMQAFVELKYRQLVEIEEKLGVITTISRELQLRNKGSVLFKDSELFEDREHNLRWHQRRFSISRTLEIWLPIIIGVVWTLFFVARLSGLI